MLWGTRQTPRDRAIANLRRSETPTQVRDDWQEHRSGLEAEGRMGRWSLLPTRQGCGDRFQRWHQPRQGCGVQAERKPPRPPHKMPAIRSPKYEVSVWLNWVGVAAVAVFCLF